MSKEEKDPRSESNQVPRGIIQAFLGLVYFGTYLSIANSVDPQGTLIEFLKVHSSPAQVVSAAGVLATEVLQWALRELKRWLSRRMMMWFFKASGADPLKELKELRKRNSQLERKNEALENENASLRQRNTELENGKTSPTSEASNPSDSPDG